ncbi:uncharacterized protein LY79DRAFT_575797 [Colletotrichum navitas]|uniref:Maltose/galactoside acetyltransferase domain-containing protein n=1 Tax=Colletotrichum navitas TaxID=681940 RepID=A0AAD8Q9S7_9PEZI|nr:uncharacterized protein LY79DRAFT_575797 [Colletotrichum navitas]KAK1598620.1 hypothetical protein LY79DRAFT_575797 [Colletotrichum navitas]
MDTHSINREENRRHMRNGELYWAFTPDLIADRKRCKAACGKLNSAGDVSRRTLVGLWKDCDFLGTWRTPVFVIEEFDGPVLESMDLTRNTSINGDTVPLPPMRARRDEDSALLENYPWIETPIKMDYGYNVKFVHPLVPHTQSSGGLRGVTVSNHNTGSAKTCTSAPTARG